MAAASYYDNGDLPSQSAGRQAESHMDQQMHGQGERGYPQQATDGQQQMMGNSAQAQGSAQPMTNGNAATGGEKAAVADDRDGLTKWLDKMERKYGGERFNNPENAEKNKALNANIIKRLGQVGKMVMQRAPQMLMNMAR